MTGPITDPVMLQERMAHYLTKTVPDVIAEHGVMIQGVFPTKAEPGYPFAYTVGLSAYGAPEVLLCGPGFEAMHSVLNTLHRRVRDQGLRLEAGMVFEDLIDGYPTMLVETTGEEEVGVARQIYGAIEVLQLVWPDKEHRWPWEEGYAFPPEAQKTWWVAPTS